MKRQIKQLSLDRNKMVRIKGLALILTEVWSNFKNKQVFDY